MRDVEIGCKKAVAVDIKEECEDGFKPKTTMTPSGDAHFSNAAINECKIKLNFNEDNLLNNYNKNSGGQDNANKNCVETKDFTKSNETSCERNDYIANEGCKYGVCCKLKTKISRRNVRTNERNYKCGSCMKSFATKETLWIHVKTHTDGLNYKCEVCDKRFATNRTMSRHTKLHTAERKYVCEICNKRFVTVQNLSNHIATHSGERNFECKICDKRFTTKHYMLQHVKAHVDEQNFKCKICERHFTTKQSLTRHMKAHAGERNHKCEICNKCFTAKHTMLQHVKVHSGERSYECEICNKRFMRKRVMLRHVKAHATDKNYRCEICKKCFVTQEYLSKHVLIHNRKRRYKCDLCDKFFTTKQSMLRHTKRHGGDENCKREIYKCIHDRGNKYDCEICHQGFREEFLEHSKTHKAGESLRNYASTTAVIGIGDDLLIKEETDSVVKKDNLENDTADINERKSLTTNESGFGSTIKENKPKTTEIFDLWQTLNDEIIIKQEHGMDTS